MNSSRSRALLVAAVLATTALAQSESRGPVDASSMHASTTQATRPSSGAAPRIVGAWQLVKRTVAKADGTLLSDPVLGEQPTGRLYYDASGVMSLQMMRAGRSA